MGDLESRLAALRQEYAAELPASVAAAQRALASVGERGRPAIEEVWQIVHRIYGTAGSYELDEVATTARALEALLGPFRDDDALPAEVARSAAEGLDALAAQALAART